MRSTFSVNLPWRVVSSMPSLPLSSANVFCQSLLTSPAPCGSKSAVTLACMAVTSCVAAPSIFASIAASASRAPFGSSLGFTSFEMSSFLISAKISLTAPRTSSGT